MMIHDKNLKQKSCENVPLKEADTIFSASDFVQKQCFLPVNEQGKQKPTLVNFQLLEVKKTVQTTDIFGKTGLKCVLKITPFH